MDSEAELTLIMKARNLAGREVDKLRGSLTGVEGAGRRAGSALGTMAKVGALGLAGLAVGAVALGPKLLDHVGRLEQMRAKAQVVFGDQLGMVESWGKANAAAMGITSREAVGLAASFGDLLVPMGFTRDQAAKMSTDVVGLSGALSQWSGGQRSSAEVADILAKAMLGERDALKGLGISITEADVQARLAAKGQQDLTGAALEQAKAVATQELIFAKSKDAQEAYAKGSANLMGVQARLTARFAEVGETVLVGLTPVLTDLMTFIEGDLIPAGAAIIGKIQAWVRANRPLIDQVMHFAGTVLKGLATTIGTVIGWIANLIGAIARNRDAMNVLRTVVGLVVSAFSLAWQAVSKLVGFIADVVGLITRNKTVIRGFATVWDIVGRAVGGVVDALQAIIRFGRRAIDIISSIKLPDLSGLPIPGFAEGGWVGLHGPELALVGERGPEYVTPAHASRGPSGDGSPAVVVLAIDGREIARVVDDRLYYDARRQPAGAGRVG